MQAENNVVSNNAGKKEANAEYQSSKKKKAAKKAGEAASQAEHKKASVNNSKPAREARYMTENGLMKTEGRKLYQAINNHQIIADAPWKSAEESMKVFLENGMVPEIKPAQAETVATTVERTVARTTETAAETVTSSAKKAGKGKWGWIAAGAGVIATAIGGKMYMDNRKSEQQLNLSA